MQAEEFRVASIHIVNRQAGLVYLFVKRLTETRADVQKGEKSGRIKAAAMAESGTNHVIVVGGDGLEDMQHRDRIFEHLIRASDQARGISEVRFVNCVERTFQLKSNALEQQFRTLMDNLKGQFIWVQELGGRLLQAQQFISPKIPFVIRSTASWQNGLAEVITRAHRAPVVSFSAF